LAENLAIKIINHKIINKNVFLFMYFYFIINNITICVKLLAYMTLITPTTTQMAFSYFKIFKPINYQDVSIKRKKISKKEVIQELKNLK